VTKTKRIALYYPLSQPSNAQGFLRGIFRYARPAKPWQFCLTFGWDTSRLVDWSPDGILGHVLSADAAAMIEQVSVPTVETAFDFAELKVPRVGFDDRAIGQLAAEHLLGLGFAQFVFAGEEGRAKTVRRFEGFEARLRAAGRTPTRAPTIWEGGSEEALRPVSRNALRWARRLPSHTAIFAASDALALHVLEIARTVGLRVPEDVAVLGVGNIDLICDLAYPQLSSIRTPAEAAGYEAARLLDSLMQGEPPPGHRIELPPLGVVTRQSTDVLAVTDVDLATALRFIRQNTGRTITVEQVADAACVSRSTLARRFRVVLGRSPLEEINRVRVERARHLLIDTNLSMTQVAKAAGFNDGRSLSEVFHTQTGDTPSGYRRRFRILDRQCSKNGDGTEAEAIHDQSQRTLAK
jgi:LacI family transcriptional regulator, galactose operon repressor